MKLYVILLSTILLGLAPFANAADTFSPNGLIKLSLPVNGVVSSINAVEGKSYKKGELLLSLDTSVQLQRLSAAQSKVKSLEADFDEAKREFERAEELYDRTVLSEHELDLARIEFVKASAAFEQAKLELTKAKWHLKYSSLKAPYAGVVSKILTHHGQAVANRLAPQVLIEYEVQGVVQ